MNRTVFPRRSKNSLKESNSVRISEDERSKDCPIPETRRKLSNASSANICIRSSHPLEFFLDCQTAEVCNLHLPLCSSLLLINHSAKEVNRTKVRKNLWIRAILSSFSSLKHEEAIGAVLRGIIIRQSAVLASSLATICAARDMLAAAATPLTRWASLLGQQLLQVTVNRSCWVTTQSLTAAPISFD